jgi:hypothetical protein
MATDEHPGPTGRPRTGDEVGAMVALYPNADVARRLARPGGEPSSDLHLTLAVLEPDQLSDTAALGRAVAAVAAGHQPLAGRVGGGIRRFAGGGNARGEPVYAPADVQELFALREDLVRQLGSAGFEVQRRHQFTPHITLSWLDPSEPTPFERRGSIPLSFDCLYLVIGPDATPFPLCLDAPSRRGGPQRPV